VSSRIETVGGTKVGYVRLAQFTKGSADALAEAVEGLREKGATSLLFDLRGDPGGLVNEAVGVAGVFLPDDSTVVVSQGLHSPRHVLRTDGTPAAGDLPLVVLVDRGSASSSEIVAGALRDAGRGKLVGQRTFGKALIQSTEPLRDGGALKLTTARYLTPKGFDLAKRGLPPDVRVADDPGTPKDEMLERGLALAAAES
jgi:carboxyl-terminal processing protease